MKVALVHDYLKEYGGAEWVVENLHQIFPQAPVFVSYSDFSLFGKRGKYFKDWDIRASFMQKIPLIKKMLAPLKWLSPMAFESFNLKEYDVVISSSAAYYAKSVITAPETLHLSYIHTPPRYLYGLTTAHGYKKNWLKNFGAYFLNHVMRIYDFEVSQRPDILVANSQTTKQRIKKFYRRESIVINPPVDISKLLRAKKGDGEYFLSFNRLDPHKRIDLIIQTFNKLNLPLKVVGSGRQEQDLKKMARENIEFLGHVSEEEKVKLLSGAKAVVLAAEDEDFGITAVEAQAAGTPVIALRRGGYLETVMEGKTGEFFPSTHFARSGQVDLEEALSEVVQNFDPKKYKVEDLRKNSERFSKERFKKEILELIDKYQG